MLSNSTTDGRDHPVVDLEAATAQATGRTHDQLRHGHVYVSV
jgi:hypothetical protein